MRDVHQHPQLIHTTDDLFAESAQAAGTGGIHRRSGPVIAVVPGERHVAHAPRVERVELLERVLDGVPAFDTHQRRHMPAIRCRPHLLGISGELDIRRRFRELANGIDQRHGTVKGSPRSIGVVDPDREKSGRYAARLHARNVDMPIREAFGDVDLPVEDALRGIDVAVEDQRETQGESLR